MRMRIILLSILLSNDNYPQMTLMRNVYENPQYRINNYY